MQVLVFVASIAVLLICHSVLTNMDETYAAKNEGYWPKPLDWSTLPDPIQGKNPPLRARGLNSA
jgi:hypothetical protein